MFKYPVRGSWLLDSTPWIPDSSFFFKGKLDSGFQSLVGFRIPKSRIPDSMGKIFPDFGFHKDLTTLKLRENGR